MDYNFSDFLNKFTTTDEVRRALAQIDHINESLYVIDKDTDILMKNFFSGPLYQSIISSLTINKIDTKDKKKMNTFFIALSDFLKKIPKITVYVAFEPHVNQIERILSWLELNVKPRPVCEFVTKPDLAAGVLLEHNGKYGNFSLKN